MDENTLGGAQNQVYQLWWAPQPKTPIPQTAALCEYGVSTKNMTLKGPPSCDVFEAFDIDHTQRRLPFGPLDPGHPRWPGSPLSPVMPGRPLFPGGPGLPGAPASPFGPMSPFSPAREVYLLSECAVCPRFSKPSSTEACQAFCVAVVKH